MLLGFWRDLGIDMTREKFERIIQRKVKKGQNYRKWQLFYINQCSSLIQINKLEGEGGIYSIFYFLVGKTEKLGISDWKTHSRALD